MGKRLATPRINKADVISINKILIDIYRNLNVIGNSADEVSYKEDKKGNKELVINDNGKEYVDNSKNASFGPNIHSLKSKIQNDLKKELSLNNVTNESKVTMLTDPTISGTTGFSHASNMLINSGTGTFKFSNTGDGDTQLNIQSGLSDESAINFCSGAVVKFRLAMNQATPTSLRILTDTDTTDGDGAAAVLDDTIFSITSAGATVTAGTVTSSNGVCSGPARHFIHTGFNYSYTAGTLIYVPINGYVIENSSSSGRNEFQTFVAPYDGYVNQVVFRSEEACGDTIVGLHKSATGTEIPNTTAVGTVTVDMAVDDTAYKFDFVNNLDGGGARTFDAGDILAISFDPTSDANDTVCTVELIFNTAEGL